MDKKIQEIIFYVLVSIAVLFVAVYAYGEATDQPEIGGS